MTSHLFTFRNITNLHAGAGDSTTGFVDKEVQRDPVEGIPIVHASSLKGSLREKWKGQPWTNEVFGADVKDNVKLQGNHIFWEARLLALPVRSSVGAYYLSTTPQLLQQFREALAFTNITVSDELKRGIDDWAGTSVNLGGPVADEALQLDRYEAQRGPRNNALATFFNYARLALFAEKDFKSLCGRLHVIARNNLDNGVSKNLWYEEVVPRFAVFYFIVQSPAADSALISALQQEPKVALGANLTIGYGQCELTYRGNSSNA